MHTTIVGVDLAKSKFQLSISDQAFRVQDRKRLSRKAFTRFIGTCPKSLFVLEACGSAQPWARKICAQGHPVRLLPAQHVRAYVVRNKTDAADADALIEASRNERIRSVPVKTVDQQQILLLHRLREQYKRRRTGHINFLRACLRECGLDVPVGVCRGLATIDKAVRDPDSGLPDGLRPWIAQGLDQITQLKRHIDDLERQIATLMGADELVRRWLEVPGVGILTATALRASTGNLSRFPTGRHLASWIGLTAREHSSGEKRRLGRISKRGDAYLRTLLTHGARSAILAAKRARKAGKPLSSLQRWALDVEQRRGHNKATVALANKLARILWAMAHHDRHFDANFAQTV